MFCAALCIALLTGSVTSVRADSAGAEAASLLSDRCATCHGESGKGDGPGASNLQQKPKNFHDRKWQKSVSDETLAKVIVQGGPAIGLSKSMPDNPDLINRPDVVNALIKQIRVWGKKR
jgi:mono/diheme cytochrome c family protein